jgi:hypothetical protein
MELILRRKTLSLAVSMDIAGNHTDLVKIEGFKGKGEAVPQHIDGGAGGERRYSSYSFITLALEGG